MRLLMYLNVSNADDVTADSGIIFATMIVKFLAGMDYMVGVIGPVVAEECFSEIPNVHYYSINIPLTKYSVRFHFDWPAITAICDQFEPELIFVNQIELCSHFRALVSTLGKGSSKIVGYCHYIPVCRDRSAISEDQYDISLDNDSLGRTMQFACVQGAASADVVLVQSRYAKSTLLSLAAKYGLSAGLNVVVASPPKDPMFSRTDYVLPSSKTVIYNHRLYGHYGTWEFLTLIQELSEDVSCDFTFCDPMPNRSLERDKLDPSVKEVKQYILKNRLGRIIPGADRVLYRQMLDNARLGFSSFQGNCVWSMSVVDLLGLGIPVIAPRQSAFPEMVPDECLFSSLSEAKELSRALLEDDTFWIIASKAAQAKSSKWTVESFFESLHAALEPQRKPHFDAIPG